MTDLAPPSPATANTQARLSAFAESPEVIQTLPVYTELPLHFDDPDRALNYLSNMDWSFTDDDTRFLGHDLHPYPAKFIPQLPGTLISLLSSRGDLILDPFGGSGTTALEAVRLGRRAISLDANPVGTLIGAVKTARVSLDAVAELHLLHGALRAIQGGLPADPRIFVDEYGEHAPHIPNREKWFPDTSFGELAYIKSRIQPLQEPTAQDIANLALSRTILPASFQDSETRYKSVFRDIPVGDTIRRYIREFEAVMRSVARNASATRYGISQFITADARVVDTTIIPDDSIDLVVTSPPYGNSMDYHLYHRFRLFWLGCDPSKLSNVEIGSHLKHQRQGSGFDSYLDDMLLVLDNVSRVLKNGRYAVFVIGDSVYDGQTYATAAALARHAQDAGFTAHRIIERTIHNTKRSFTTGRRATSENILILQKTPHRTPVILKRPPYKLWPYEEILRVSEGGPANQIAHVELDAADLTKCRSMVFTHQIRYADGHEEPTWQAIVENGMASNPVARKDPKYVTHGLHPYKGKFYPQLAKALINKIHLPHGSTILDPFCGSGTTLLEGYLNGHKTFGSDLNPLGAKIAHAKTAILLEEPDVVSEVIASITRALRHAPKTFPNRLTNIPSACHEEVERWFAPAVARKLNWIIGLLRSSSAGVIQHYLEVVLSSIIRDVSQQEPSDLRIRYRESPLTDADVIGIFSSQLDVQFARLEKFWKIRGYAPNPFFSSMVVCGDNRRRETYDALGLGADSVDLVLTSPPYAMALPYIDTDRLSLLTLMGLGTSQRRPIEQELIGSRELTMGKKKVLEAEFLQTDTLPADCLQFIRTLNEQVNLSTTAGFRRRNMPALMHRFLKDMDATFAQLYRVCRPGSEAMVVIGDSRITIDDSDIRIPTTDLTESIATRNGFATVERIDITVTTENLAHIKNAITENVVLRFNKH